MAKPIRISLLLFFVAGVAQGQFLNFVPPGCQPTISTHQNFSEFTIPTSPSGPIVVESSINVAGFTGYLWHVKVFTDIEHTHTSDLDVTVEAPDGRVVTLSTDNGVSFDDVFAGTSW